MESLKNKIENFKKGSVPLDMVFEYSPPKFYPNWNKQYNSISLGKSSKSNYKRPAKQLSNFKLKLNDHNKLNLSEESKGIYLLYKNNQFFYVGQTNKMIVQRFNAHIAKITSTNNNSHDHPMKWQQCAIQRYDKLQEDSVLISDLNIYFFDLLTFQDFLNNRNNEIKALINEFEALIFCFFKYSLFLDLVCLNTENRINKNFLNYYKNFWINNS